MKFFKKHKLLCIIALVVILLIIFVYLILRQFMPDLSKSEYGNRLSGISSIKISNTNISKLEDDIKTLDNVKKVEYDLKGRLINIVIDVSNDVSLDTAKDYANKSLEYFSEEEKAYYDIQVFITCSDNNDSEIYPVIGYKHKTSSNLVWKQ